MRFSCARIFSDHMVLQRNRPIAVFGQGPDGETVEAELLGRRARAACAGGKWLLFLPAMDARGPLELRVRCGAEEAVFSDVALGEVWLAGGQSNMELILENAKSGGAEIPKALEIEGETIRRLGNDPACQAAYIKKIMDEHISTYLEARENGGETFPDFIGAAALDELALCRELSAKYRAKKQTDRAARQAAAEAEQKRKREETNRRADEQIQKAVHVLKHGGVLENEMIHLYRADGGYGSYAIVNHLMRLYGVEVPLRTQGWINEKLVSTKAAGSGIGTESIRMIAEQYRGDARFEWRDGVFYASVMLNP